VRPVGQGLDHVQGRHALSMSVGQRQAGIDQQAVAVFHQAVPHEAQLRLLALSLAVEPGIGIGGRGMRIVRPLLAMKVGFRVAPAACRRFARARALRLDALHRRPRLDQRAVDREVIRGQKLLHLGLRQHRRQELRRDVAFQQPVAVLGEHRMVPGRVVDADADEPAEQEVVFQTLHQKPFRPDRVECLQQHRPQQLLGRDRGPPHRRIQCREIPLQCQQRFVHEHSNTAQRMVTPDPRLKVNVAEQFTRSLVPTAHASLSESLRSQ
jgi:hypothetical protein